MEFAQFWNSYPRKVARRAAETAWNKLSTGEQQQAIESLPNHIKYWQARGTEKEFIPHASTWLNQARWEDEIELPKVQDTTIKVAWWQSEQTMLAKGMELGTQPRPGEGWNEFKGRLITMMQRAA